MLSLSDLIFSDVFGFLVICDTVANRSIRHYTFESQLKIGMGKNKKKHEFIITLEKIP